MSATSPWGPHRCLSKRSGMSAENTTHHGECAEYATSLVREGKTTSRFGCLVSSPSKSPFHFLISQMSWRAHCTWGSTHSPFPIWKTSFSSFSIAFPTPCPLSQHTLTPFVSITKPWVVSDVIYLSQIPNLSSSQYIHWSGRDRVPYSAVRGDPIHACAFSTCIKCQRRAQDAN